MAPGADAQTHTRRLVRAGLLTEVLEAALDVARRGEDDDPPIPPPGALRPLLRFRRLPATAREAVGAALVADDAFLARVQAAVADQKFGRAARIWLDRSPTWISELEPYVEDDEAERDSEPDPRTLARRLQGAERAAKRAAERSAELEAEADRLRQHATAARAEARAMQRERDSARRDAAAAQSQVDELQRSIEAAERNALRRTEERRRLQARIRELEDSIGFGTTARDAHEMQRLSRAVLGALRAATADAEALDRELAGRLNRAPRAARSARPAPAAAGRRPVRMPGGIVDDSVAAAEHLVGRPEAALVVDGYNVTLTAWPELRLDQGRDRLVSLLDELAGRISALECHVVFDGAAVAPVARRRRAGAVHVRFTTEDVEADDVVLAIAGEIPASRPVIVASNDRRVRDGARERGANVISVQQLLALAR